LRIVEVCPAQIAALDAQSFPPRPAQVRLVQLGVCDADVRGAQARTDQPRHPAAAKLDPDERRLGDGRGGEITVLEEDVDQTKSNETTTGQAQPRQPRRRHLDVGHLLRYFDLSGDLDLGPLGLILDARML
jgi:hypothetical protein